MVGSRHKGTTSNPACQTWDPHLVQGHVPDGRAIDFQDPVPDVDGILHIRTHAARVHSADTEQWSDLCLPQGAKAKGTRSGVRGQTMLSCVTGWQLSRALKSGLVGRVYLQPLISYWLMAYSMRYKQGFPDGSVCLPCRRPGLDPWVRKIPWRREWLPSPVFLSGEFHALRSLLASSQWGRKQWDRTERLTFSLSLSR